MSVNRVPRLLAVLGLWLAVALPAFAAEDVVVVLDNSGSMKANDPNRLAGQAVMNFVANLKGDVHVSVIEFSTTPTLLMPLTPLDDETRRQVQQAVAKLDYKGQWTDTGAALERALYEMDSHGRPDALRCIVLMTDGYVDVGNASRDSDKIHWIIQSLIPEAVAKKVRIFGVAFTDQADYELLQQLAQKTGAGYYRAYQAGDLDGIYRQISDTLTTGKPVSQPADVGNLQVAAPTPVPQSFSFNTPLTHMQQAEEESWRTLLVVVVVLVLLAVLGGGGFYVWKKGGIKKMLPKRPKEDSSQTGGLQAVLYDISNPNDIKRYELGEKATVIGRVAGYDPEVQYVLAAEPTVGRSHALIERRGHSFWITDQGSINGTFVNGERVAGDHALKHGDIVAVHRHEFEFVLPELFESESTVLAAREEYGYAEKRQA